MSPDLQGDLSLFDRLGGPAILGKGPTQTFTSNGQISEALMIGVLGRKPVADDESIAEDQFCLIEMTARQERMAQSIECRGFGPSALEIVSQRGELDRLAELQLCQFHSPLSHQVGRLGETGFRFPTAIAQPDRRLDR